MKTWLLLFGLAMSVEAATNTWIGAVDGNWAEPGNWDLGRAPTGGDVIVLPAGASNKVQSAISAGTTGPGDQVNLYLQEGGYIIGNGNANLTFGWTISSVGTNEVNCKILHQNQPTYISNDGLLKLGAANSVKGLNLQGNGDITFKGPVTAGSGRSLVMTSTGATRLQYSMPYFSQVSGSLAVGMKLQAAGILLVNCNQQAGTLVCGIGGGATLGGTGQVSVANNSTYAGSGLIGVGYRPNTQQPAGNGSIAPGDPEINGGIGMFRVSTGDRLIFGSDTAATTGTLTIQVGEAGVADQLALTGNLDLSSAFDVLNLAIAPGVTPVGDYPLVSFTGSRTGEFATVLLNGVDITDRAESGFSVNGSSCRLVYEGDSDGLLKLVATPGKGTLMLVR